MRSKKGVFYCYNWRNFYCAAAATTQSLLSMIHVLKSCEFVMVFNILCLALKMSWICCNQWSLTTLSENLILSGLKLLFTNK